MRAMIIDDSMLLRNMVERAVRSTELPIEEFVHATNGKDAMQVLRQELRAGRKFHLIVTDTNMPAMSGLEFLEAVQMEKLCVDAQIIMITTENSPEHLARAKGSRFQGKHQQALHQ